eukprot:TRINITY_DN121467_c0_g1_i1.p2 TRINITY_DN121467_c0_g1~~TRINITY_DN121467_c0_g1_i1.p2  ORF type:complete len:360 (+),score=163.06 TRINITY_DN121467_c0_g1_i1:63-1142(+)
MARLLLLFTLPLVSAVVLRTSSKNGREEPEEPEGSELIKGPDCGHANVVVPMYRKAAEAGSAAGVAQGAITAATAAAEAVTVAKTRADEIAAAIGGDEVPKGIELAGTSAEEAGTKATEAATALQTSLDTFKTKVSGSDMAGSDVSSSDTSELKKLTDEANTAAKDAQEAADRLFLKAKEEKAKAMQDTAKAAKLITEFVEKAKPVMAEAADVAQKSKHATDDVDVLLEKTADVLTKLDDKIADEETGDQKPVWEAFKAGVEAKNDALSDAKDAVLAEIDPVNTAAGTLEEKVGPLAEAAETAAGGDSIFTTAGELAEAETALDDAEMAISKLKGEAKTMMENQAKFEEKLKTAEEKLA